MNALVDGGWAFDPQAATVVQELRQQLNQSSSPPPPPDRDEPPPGNKEDLRALLRDIRALSFKPTVGPAELLDIIGRARTAGRDARADDQVTKALLQTYGRLLSRKTHAVSAELLKLIDRDLVRIGKLELEQRTTRLLWAKVVSVMGDRASQRLRSTLAHRLKSERDSAVRGALERAAKRLKR